MRDSVDSCHKRPLLTVALFSASTTEFARRVGSGNSRTQAEMGERFDERPDLALAESFYKTYTPPSQQGNRRTKQIFDISNQYKSLAVIAGTV
eukprot:4783385-Amphidinium_carterae.1